MGTLATLDVTLPSDTELADDGAGRIRDGRLANVTTVGLEHQLTGEHKFPSGTTLARPAAGNAGRLYLNDDGNVEKDNGTTWELATGFVSGTVMLFYQATAPVGWTINTSLNDKVIMINSASGGVTGGSWTISGISTTAGHLHTTAGHTLSIAEIPSHNHTVPFVSVSFWSGGSSWHPVVAGTTASSYTGGGGSHTHGDTGTAGAHTHTFDGTWRPAYANIIVCSKD